MFWLILSVLLWGILHSLLASLKANNLALGWFGAKFMHLYRLIYNVFAALSFMPVLGIAALTADRTLYVVPFPWAGLMVLGETSAVAGLVIGFLQTDAWDFLGLRQLREIDRPTQLKTSGLYRYVRHPLYAAGLAFIWLYPHMTANLMAINVALTIYILIGAFFEERKLRREYGREYIDYAAVTPMLIPFVKRNKPLL
jgi:protein-S-isoprenylcysteine O-methyltransferase Ste14